jgi:hypothetical protein
MDSQRPGSSLHRLLQKRRSSDEMRTAMLHALLDKALAAGAPAIEVESALADLLNMARRRTDRDDLRATGRRASR